MVQHDWYAMLAAWCSMIGVLCCQQVWCTVLAAL